MSEPDLPRPLPGPRQDGTAKGATSRRWFLAGGVAAVLGAGAGVAAEFVHDRHDVTPPPSPPPALKAAAEAERTLIADLDATTGGAPVVRRVIVQARADHAAHLAALSALLAAYRQPSPSVSPSAPPGTPRTLAQLRAAETKAAAAAARHADALRGKQAALLASIAACEATHAELLR
jgi:hypothetical protein